MNKTILIFVITLLPLDGFCQNDTLARLNPYFSALIVKNIDSSIAWYSKNLGFKVLNKKDFPESGFKQANLKKDHAMVELLELSTAIAPETAIPNYSQKMRMQGIFKIGFQVYDFDTWVKLLTQSKAVIQGRVVVDELSGKRMLIDRDPDGNRIQLFEK